MWIPLLTLVLTITQADAARPAPKAPKATPSQPTPSQAPKTTAVAFGELSEPALRTALGAMGEPVELDPTQEAATRRVVDRLAAGDEDGARKAWARLVKLRHTRDRPVNVDALVGLVLRESYLQSNEDLAFHASKVAFHNEKKRAIRDELQGLRDALAVAHEEGATTVDVSVVIVRTHFKSRSRAVLAHKTITLSIEQTQAKLSRDTAWLASVGDDAQLANIDLQNALQKQQQTLQTMSNVSKMLHDTAMAVIRKIGG